MTVAKRTKRAKPDPDLTKLADSLLVNYRKPEDLIGENGLLKQLTKMLVERALEAEMTDHLGHDKSGEVTNETANTRNGYSAKTLKGDFGALPLDIPRDRQGTFAPQIVGKHQTRWTGFDDKIISLYARGLTVREIQSHLEEIYGAEVSPSLISSAQATLARLAMTSITASADTTDLADFCLPVTCLDTKRPRTPSRNTRN